MRIIAESRFPFFTFGQTFVVTASASASDTLCSTPSRSKAKRKSSETQLSVGKSSKQCKRPGVSAHCKFLLVVWLTMLASVAFL